MIQYNNLYNNKNMKVINELGCVKVFEHQKDLSVYSPVEAINAYYAAKMNVRKRQVLIELNGNAFTISAGSMQWMSGDVDMVADVKGIGDLFGKALSSKVTKESAIKPKYKGNGLLMLEPTYKHILLEEVSQWKGLVLDDGLFLACDSNITQKVVARTNLSSAALGNEGLFNLCLMGQGIAVLESPVPREELIEFNLQDDVLKIDGNMAIAWSNSLEFKVEKSGKSLLGSAVSGEGFVNVYRGTGKVLVAPSL
ncbi:MAG: AIM24 family protein [Cellulosilyticum sp.]|nr:AIM24 family protein [Cellulosilyticum sp.]